MAAATTSKREPVYFKLSDNNHFQLNLKRSSYSAGLLTAIGGSTTKPTTGTILTGGKESAAQRGVFFLAIYYEGRNNKLQRAIIPVAPDKADTAFEAVQGQTYNNKQISKASAVRRVKYVI